MSTDTQVDVGSEFLGYQIEELIGRGGMGVVYRAYDLRLKRTVALKLVSPELALDQRFRERFSRETEVAMSLEHPNVVPVYDAGDVGGRLYLAMRLVGGTDLRELLASEGPLEPSRAVAICRQVANALDAAHTKGLVHRDVKPSNVLLDESEHVYLADFGLARAFEEPGAQPGDGRSIGTPAYLAPEQIEAEPVDGRADVYALGCLLFQCLTGEPPYVRGSRLAVAWAHLEEEPPRASEHKPGLPQAVDPVIAKAMAKEPEDRYPTCAALISAAQHALGLGRSTPLLRRKSVLLLAVIMLMVLAAATVAAVLATDGHGKGTAPLFARGDSLARIDPATNKVSAVIDVGRHPVLAAAAGHSVWVYNEFSGTISEIDAGTNRVLKTTRLSGSRPAQCCSLFAGPVLAADASGAWFVNGGVGDAPRLTHVLAGVGSRREYPLDLTPTGVAVGEDAVWVVGHRGQDSQVLRIDPGTGRVTARTSLPGRSIVDSIVFGYDAVWAMGSSTATLYRIDPRLPRRPESVVLGGSPAMRPEIIRYGGDIIVRTTGRGGREVRINPVSLTPFSYVPSPFPPDWEEYDGDLGALWWYDWPSGTVNRQQAADGPVTTIQVVKTYSGHPCLTSMAAGSGSLWVTAAAGNPPNGSACVR